ncbi:hypothetical protein AVANS14531_00760 [Campylobacter sp. Cr9]|uniref:hypothetical protein n=1 Tax=Campylobacter sp. Cr9 TaxID=2735728 RepID=UPI00301447FA|nr:hypothetical protein [Campylobacter sp. Cr9]
MNNLDYLKSFSVKEIASKTHLDEARIKAIINKDYESLSNVNVAMNIKILEREYNIDFSEWLQEYNEYKSNNLTNTKNSLKVKPKVMGYNSGNESSSNLAYFIYLSIATIVVIAGAFYYFNYYNEDTEEVKETPQQLVKEEVKEEIIIPLEEIKKEPIKEIIKEPIKEIKQAQEVKEEIKQEVKEVEENKQEIIKPIKEEVQENIEIKELKDTPKPKEEIKEEVKVEVKKENKLLLTPSTKAWVSVKNLKTKETKNYMVTKNVSFNQDSLIFVGNNLFSLSLNETNVELPKNSDPRYILFKDGKVKFITQKEYSKLDKAK